MCPEGLGTARWPSASSITWSSIIAAQQKAQQLTQKHIAFNAQGKAVGLKETPSQIHSDLQKASQEVRNTKPRDVLSKVDLQKVHEANTRGRVVGLSRIKGMVSGTEASGKASVVPFKAGEKTTTKPGVSPPQTIL